jgi:hypothetical protein
LKKLITIAALFLFSESAAYADGLCSANLSDDDLVGNYTINLGPGTLTVITENGGQRVHPVPLKTGTATISIHDGVPILHSDDIADGGVLNITLTHAGSNEKDLTFLEDQDFPSATAKDMATVLDCDDASDLPQLIGIGSVNGNGVVVPNESKLMVYQQDEGGISAIGGYDSAFSPPGSGGTVVFHVQISIERN